LFVAFGCKQKSNPAGATDPTSTNTPFYTKTITPTVTITGTTTPTPTATTTNTPNITIYSFESGLDGWSKNSLGMGVTTVAYNTDTAYTHSGSAGSLRADSSFYSPYNLGWVSLTLSHAVNMTGKTISAWIYVPSSLAAVSSTYTAFIEIYGSNSYQTGTSYSLNTSGWVQLQYTPSGAGEDAVTKVVIVVLRTLPDDWSGSYYLDDISW
jgi:hypothetical protein